MVVLRQQLPSKDIQPMWPNVKIYTGALNDDILSVLDGNGLDAYAIPQIMDPIDSLQQITLIRHFESQYNQYRREIVSSDLYKNLLVELDPAKKYALAVELFEDFKKNVWLDYATGLSSFGHKQGEKTGKLYADLVKEKPSIFPTMIEVSPYLRTRITAHYFLRYIDWLDLDFEFLLREDARDMVVGSFRWKEVVVKLNNILRERSYGMKSPPTYLKEYFDAMSPLNSLSGFSGYDIHQLNYFLAVDGGTSQPDMEDKGQQYYDYLSRVNHKNIQLFTHELLTLGTVNNSFGWSYRTFANFYKYRRPENGSLTVISRLAKTQMWQKNRLRVTGYNLMLEE